MQANGTRQRPWTGGLHFLCEGGTPVPKRTEISLVGIEVIPEHLRSLKEQRCQLLEHIHQQQQQLDQLDYKIFKFLREHKGEGGSPNGQT